MCGSPNGPESATPLPHSTRARPDGDGADLDPEAIRKIPEQRQPNIIGGFLSRDRTRKTCFYSSDAFFPPHVSSSAVSDRPSECEHHAWTHLIQLNELRVRPWHLNSNLHYVLLLRHFDTRMPFLLKLWGEMKTESGHVQFKSVFPNGLFLETILNAINNQDYSKDCT